MNSKSLSYPARPYLKTPTKNTKIERKREGRKEERRGGGKGEEKKAGQRHLQPNRSCRMLQQT